MTDEHIRAFRLLVNRSATWAEWIPEAVAVELAALRDLDIDLEQTGFDECEIARYLHSLLQEEKDPDAAPELPAAPVSRDGDLWLLGDDHRVICGDATIVPPYRRLMEQAKAEMIWTDPPYNVAYEGKAGSIKNDAMSDDDFIRFLSHAFGQMAGFLKAGGAVYVAHADGGFNGLNFRKAFLGAGFKFASCLIWRKNQAILSRADYHWQHEPILYGWLPGAPHRWYGDRKQVTVYDAFPTAVEARSEDGRSVWNVVDGERLLRITGSNVLVEELPASVIHAAKPQASEQHPTMKPVALIERMLMNSSAGGDIVLDPFGGSGSTLMACERSGRRCRTMELDPRFVDVIVRRWEEATGNQARHEIGKTYSELMEERLTCPAERSGAERGGTGERRGA
jgi:DNA modification methylase